MCDLAERGLLHCPLNVRSTSEDVITGELFGKLQLIDPRWWLPDLLNRSLKASIYRQQFFRGFQIRLWEKQPPYPPELLPWREGQTEVDVEIRWENPATTIYIEMKFASDVSKTTSRTDGTEAFPSDQLIRNLRIGLHQAGWFRRNELFGGMKRRFALVLLSPRSDHHLVDLYRNRQALMESIPGGEELTDLPSDPVIGAASYSMIAATLRERIRFMSASERAASHQIDDYLEFKMGQSKQRASRVREDNPTLQLC
jgi:hypothetical protein